MEEAQKVLDRANAEVNAGCETLGITSKTEELLTLMWSTIW